MRTGPRPPPARRLVVVTGSQGFLGSATAAAFRRSGARVLGLGRSPRRADTAADEYRQLDVRDERALATLLRAVAPDAVVHAAGAQHHADPAAQQELNVDAARAVVRACALAGRPRVVLVSSAAVYGAVARVAHEDLPCAPHGAYGCSKRAAEVAATELAAAHDMPLVLARVFNLCGPGQDGRHVCGALARAVCAVLAGEADCIQAGALSPRRDFVDVRDAADALVTLAAWSARCGPVNVATGIGTSVGEVLACLLRLAALPVTTRVRRGRHPVGVACAVGDSTRLRASGWRPRPLAQSLQDQLAALLRSPALTRHAVPRAGRSKRSGR